LNASTDRWQKITDLQAMIDVWATETWRDKSNWPPKLTDRSFGELMPLHSAFHELGEAKYGEHWSTIVWRFRCSQTLGLDSDVADYSDEIFEDIVFRARLTFPDLTRNDFYRRGEDILENALSRRLQAALEYIKATFSEVSPAAIEPWTNTSIMLANAFAQRRIQSFACHENKVEPIPFSAWFIGGKARDARFAHGRIDEDPYLIDPAGSRDIYLSAHDFSVMKDTNGWELSPDKNGSIRSMILEFDAAHLRRKDGHQDGSTPANKEEAIQNILRRWPNDRERIEAIWAALKMDKRLRSLGVHGKTLGTQNSK
jgi:hypothetical protein